MQKPYAIKCLLMLASWLFVFKRKAFAIWFSIIFFFSLLSLPCSSLAPVNPHLSQSAWSIAQLDNYAQASSDLPGPLYPGAVDQLFDKAVAGSLTVLYSEDGKVVWGSSLTSVFKVGRSGSAGLRLIDSLLKPTEGTKQDTFRGIYCVLTKDQKFYISSGNLILMYTDKIAGDSLSGIVLVETYDFGRLAKPKERVLSLNLSYDGKIVFCSTHGAVGVLSRDLKSLLALKYSTADNGESPRVSVTNSVSIDEFGGIYVVTSRYIHRIWWDGKRLHSAPPLKTYRGNNNIKSKNNKNEQNNDTTQNNDKNKKNNNDSNSAGDNSNELEQRSRQDSFRLACLNNSERHCEVWSTAYAVADKPILSRPTKEGSGTTPSLLRDEITGKLYVMIADGQVKQEVLAVDAQTGDIVASAPVRFDENRSAESYTEQSILVNGNKLLVTQNALTNPGQRVNQFLSTIRATDIVATINMPEFVQDNVYLLPVVLGDSPRGFQQFELLVKGNKVKLVTTWTRNDIGCPNAIPTMSTTTKEKEPRGVVYCVGKSNSLMSEVISQGMTAGWTIEAFDWATGESVFTVRTGNSILYNSLYAATQIGPDREIIHGSIGGLVRLRSESQNGSSSFGSAIADLIGAKRPPLLNKNSTLLAAPAMRAPYLLASNLLEEDNIDKLKKVIRHV